MNAKALAFLSSEAVTPGGDPVGTITSAIEIKDGAIVYHSVRIDVNAARKS